VWDVGHDTEQEIVDGAGVPQYLHLELHLVV
jgi:hypothetical protein